MKKSANAGLVYANTLYTLQLNNKTQMGIVSSNTFERLCGFVVSLKAIKRYYIFLLPFIFVNNKEAVIC
ncbi:MAG: hypothetical protein AB9856_04940 [Cellulosilyticaceae bacterium]